MQKFEIGHFGVTFYLAFMSTERHLGKEHFMKSRVKRLR